MAKKSLNEDFFGRWRPQMAYILGFFCADGSMYRNKRGACYLTIEIIDKELLEKIKAILGAGQKLTFRKRTTDRRPAWRIQIGNKRIFERFLELGITPNKERRLRIPLIPQKYARDFIRGYFDGDGNVQFGKYIKSGRKRPTPILLTRFISCSKGMLQDIADKLYKNAKIRLKKVYYNSKAWRLDYSTKDSVKLYKHIYRGADIFLERKKQIFERYLNMGR